MWLVRIALRRPYTFIVMSMLIVIVGVLTILRMPTDIFPNIEIPVISVIWNYQGLPPEEMERRIVNTFERNLTTTVNDIEHIESQSLTGVSVIKIFLQPGAKVEAAIAEVTAVSQTALRMLPPGATPPLIIRYSASNVPILQLALASESLSEQQLFDYGTNFIRGDLATIQGAQLPWPYGGKQRQVMIDIDPKRIAESRANARAAGVEHLVEFRLEDVMTSNVSEATVVTLYLLSSSNAKLQPALKAQLRPGARIVSHAFSMGPEWPADKVDQFTSERGDEVTLYLWRIGGQAP